MNQELFYSLGLTKNEAKVYISLLELGNAQVGQITEKSGIHRRNVYDSISRLMEKGLLSSVIVNNKKIFSPVNPKRFLELIDEKSYELSGLKSKFNEIMPKLELMAKLKEKHDVRFFKGAEGLKSVFEDILRTNEDYIGYGPKNELGEILKHYYRHVIERRVKAKLHTRFICGEESRDSKKPNPYSQIRYIPQEYSSKAALRIYGDKVAILLLSKQEPIAIVIKNKAIADGYRKYFEVMWKNAKP